MSPQARKASMIRGVHPAVRGLVDLLLAGARLGVLTGLGWL